MYGKLTLLEQKTVQGKGISRQEALELLEMMELMGDRDVYDLLTVAGRITRCFGGCKVELCSIVNAKSGRCSEDCTFCAQSVKHRTDIKVYPLLTPEEILRQAISMEKAGVARFSLVTSGKGISGRELEGVLKTVYILKRETNLQVCASLGIIGISEATMLRQAGVTTYHHNLETAPDYYPVICSTHTYQERLRTIEAAALAGLRVCAGGIIGLGETMLQRIEMALELRKLNVDSIPVNFLNPIPGTPLERNRVPSPLELLKVIALFRLILPRSIIRLCGGRREGLRGTQALAFIAGVNGLMVGDYLTTRGGSLEEDLRLLHDLGLEPC